MKFTFGMGSGILIGKDYKGERKMSRNLTLLTDLYELTMMQGYFERGDCETVVFDMFFRSNPNQNGYSIAAGLEQVIDYVKNLGIREGQDPPLQWVYDKL